MWDNRLIPQQLHVCNLRAQEVFKTNHCHSWFVQLRGEKPDISLQCSCHDGDGKHQEGVGHLATTTRSWLGWRSGCGRPASTQVGSNTWGQTSSLNNGLSFSLPREHVGMYRIWVTEQMLKIRRKCFENVMSSAAFCAHNYVCTNTSRGSRIL